jgi:uncharacterized membrane protein YedE/YeeE
METVFTPIASLVGGMLIGLAAVTLMLLGEFLVGIGVTLGSGCTSGHGVCGMVRLSPRSFAATATFMLTTGLTVYVIRHILGT